MFRDQEKKNNTQGENITKEHLFIFSLRLYLEDITKLSPPPPPQPEEGLVQ